MTRRRERLAGVLLLLAGCGHTESGPVRAERRDRFEAPADDRSASCSDVGTLRACWGCDDGACLVTAPAPAPPARSTMGWRCTGAGKQRSCRDRAALAGPFECSGARCEQRHPRLPDDGEWQCAEAAGAAVCVGGEPAAGVAPAPPDPGWQCGERRRGSPAGAREHVCVDFSPDFPEGRAQGWRCKWEHAGGTRRICERAAGMHALGDACDRARPCVDGARCAGGSCVPAQPEPSCWLDTDCDGAACRFGTCQGSAR